MSLPLGHNFGCHHNPEETTSSYFSYGHGHLIEQGSASRGYRTILAYSAEGHTKRVNYYSNPSVDYPVSQTPTGVEGLSDNARVITQNRFAFASLGDESATCTDNFSTFAPTTTTTPAPSPPSSMTLYKNKFYQYQKKALISKSKKEKNAQACLKKCKVYRRISRFNAHSNYVISND